ncbi:ribosomal protein L27 [Rhinocladiella mackenziei CBS 650.93]|uniref:Large ribosomal subunit protein bL27m n=1 Tax=Rhinocladiella mackenziei CBS 650.93 TaxID=1442369 RepID=A0A0D2IUD8_9EURO|nr:ribosomal protein L27 [Rhinocladiella mackenziei CBS 650.93]KIX09679.1 ribosomal protein L27 [Rhinocladiella mackenziei CBS 650.93]
MLQPQLYRPTVANEASFTALATSLKSLSLCSKQTARISTNFVRYASHAAQGRANGPKDSAGRRLGAKKSASEYVIPGNIIFRQRGTKWHPGENVGMGKDHTIYATEYGYVRYYRDPLRHPKRRYIGVALEREGPGSQLPLPPNAPRRRRLGMYATPIKVPETQTSDKDYLEPHLSSNSYAAFKSGVTPAPPATIFRKGTYREANVSIGLAAERKGVKVREYDRRDRWLAWRRRTAKVKLGMAAKAAKAARKKAKSSSRGGKKVA